MKKFIITLIIILMFLSFGVPVFAEQINQEKIEDLFEATDNPQIILNKNIDYAWDILRGYGYSEVATAAILGNFHRESRLIPYSVEGYTMEEALSLRKALLKNKDTFIYQLGGYGLAGWTLSCNLEQLWNWCEEHELAVDSYEGQLSFFNYDYERGQPNSFTRINYYEPKDIVTATEDFRQSYERSVMTYETQYRRATYAKAIYIRCTENKETIQDVIDAPLQFDIYLKVNEMNDLLGLKRTE